MDTRQTFDCVIFEGLDQTGKSTLDKCFATMTGAPNLTLDRAYLTLMVYTAPRMRGKAREDYERALVESAYRFMSAFDETLVVITVAPYPTVLNRMIGESPRRYQQIVDEFTPEVYRETLAAYVEAANRLPFHAVLMDTTEIGVVAGARLIATILQNGVEWIAEREPRGVKWITSGQKKGKRPWETETVESKAS